MPATTSSAPDESDPFRGRAGEEADQEHSDPDHHRNDLDRGCHADLADGQRIDPFAARDLLLEPLSETFLVGALALLQHAAQVKGWTNVGSIEPNFR